MQALPTGFEAVYRREFSFVWAAARRFGVHPAALDDAVQDVFVTAHRRWDDLDTEVSPRAWLYGVTRRVAFRYRRTEARKARRRTAVHAASGRSEEPHAALESRFDVDAVLARLPPGRREVFVMSELLDMSGPEIAAELELPLNTVYSRLRLARKQLARSIDANDGWLHAARRSQRPPRGQTRRTWAVLVPSLGRLSLGPIGIGLGGMLATVSATAVGVLVLVGVALREPSPPPATNARSDPAPATFARASPRPRTPAAPAPSPTTPVASATSLTPPPPPLRASTSSPRPPRAERARAEAPSEPSPLDAEVVVLDRAAEALRRGQAARALQWLAEHEARFPAGHLADVRMATRVRALCRLGRRERAEAEAAALRREHPSSAVARGLSDSCDDA